MSQDTENVKTKHKCGPVEEKIDIVYTWVNGSDPKFMEGKLLNCPLVTEMFLVYKCLTPGLMLSCQKTAYNQEITH